MARNVYGLDLGTYEVKVYEKNQDKIWKQKSVVATLEGNQIIACGDEAYEMYEKVPANIQVVFPMKHGVICRMNDMQYLLQALLRQDRTFARGSEYLIAAPTDVTQVEKRAFLDLVVHSAARAHEVNIVDRAIANCVGMNIDLEEKQGIMVVDFGGDTTEISIISNGGILFTKLVKVGGNTFDTAVANLVKRSHDLLIGHQTAESLRRRFGVFGGYSEGTMTVAGRNVVAGLPQRAEISISLVRAAMREPLQACIQNINNLLERTPPEVYRSIQKNGIYLTGGLANMPGLGGYIEGTTGYPVHIARQPEICAIDGLRKMAMDEELLKKYAYSSIDVKYRWMV